MSRQSKWHDSPIEKWSDRKQSKPRRLQKKPGSPHANDLPENANRSEFSKDIRRALCWSASHDDFYGLTFDEDE